MALTKCKECGKEVSDSAGKCPNCGAKVKKPIGVIGVVAALIFGAIVFRCSSPTVTPPLPAQSAPSQGATGEPTPEPPQVEKRRVTWEYDTDVDQLSGKGLKAATLMSDNSHQLSFPYHGGTQGVLILRNHPRHGKAVIFSVNKGQLLCNSYDGCSVTIRFDDAKPYKLGAGKPADHNNTTLFLDGYKGLVEKIKKSKSMIIEAVFYKEGPRAFEFNVEGLDVTKL